MTSPQDEITNLRAALNKVLAAIKHERANGDPTDANSSGNIMGEIEAIVKRGLKAPRASKTITLTIGEGIPPISKP